MAPKTTVLLHLPRGTGSPIATSPPPLHPQHQHQHAHSTSQILYSHPGQGNAHSHQHQHQHSYSTTQLLHKQHSQGQIRNPSHPREQSSSQLINSTSNSQQYHHHHHQQYTSSQQNTPSPAPSPDSTAATATAKPAAVLALGRSSTLQKKKRRVKALSVGNSPHERSASMSSTGSAASASGSLTPTVGSGEFFAAGGERGGNSGAVNVNNSATTTAGNSGQASVGKTTYISRVALGLRALGVGSSSSSGGGGGSNNNNTSSPESSRLDGSASARGAGVLFSGPQPTSSSIQHHQHQQSPQQSIQKPPSRGLVASNGGSRPATPVDVFKPLPSRPGSDDDHHHDALENILIGLDAPPPPRSHSRLGLAGMLSEAHQSLLFVDPEPPARGEGGSATPPPAGGEKVTRLEPIIPAHLLDQMVSSPQEMSPASTLVNPFFNRTLELERRIWAAAAAGRASGADQDGREGSRPSSRERERSSSRGRVRVVEIRSTPGGGRVARSLSRSDSQKRLSRARNGGSVPRAGTSMGLVRPGDSRSSSVSSHRRSAIEDGFMDVSRLGSEISGANPFAEEEAAASRPVQPRGRRRVPAQAAGADMAGYASAREQIGRRREKSRREERERRARRSPTPEPHPAVPSAALRTRLMGGRQPRTPSPLRHAASDRGPTQMADMDAISAAPERLRSALATHARPASETDDDDGPGNRAAAASIPRRKPVPAGFMAAAAAAVMTSADNSEDEDEAVPTPATGTFVTPLLPTPFPSSHPHHNSHRSELAQIQSSRAQRRAERAFKSVSMMALPPTPPASSSTPPPSAVSTIHSANSSTTSLHKLTQRGNGNDPPLSPPLTDISDHPSRTGGTTTATTTTTTTDTSATTLTQHNAQRLHNLEQSLHHERQQWENERRSLHTSLSHLQNENESLRQLVHQLTERMERSDAVYIKVQQQQQQQQQPPQQPQQREPREQTKLGKAWGMFMLNPRSTTTTPPVVSPSQDTSNTTSSSTSYFHAGNGRKSPQAFRGGRAVTPSPGGLGMDDVNDGSEYFPQSGRSTPAAAAGRREVSPQQQQSSGRTGGLWKRSAGRAKKPVVLMVKD